MRGVSLRVRISILIAGPWVHIPWGDRAGEVDFGEAANLNTDEILLRWFNHWLKDSREFESEAAGSLFCDGSERVAQCGRMAGGG